MQLGFYVVYDRVAQEAGPVFQSKNDTSAIRSTSFLLKDTFNASDYDLIHLGFFDTETLELSPVPIPQKVPFMFTVSDGSVLSFSQTSLHDDYSIVREEVFNEQ